MDKVFVDVADEGKLEDALSGIRYEAPISQSGEKLVVSLYGDETNRLMRNLRQRGVDYNIKIAL